MRGGASNGPATSDITMAVASGCSPYRSLAASVVATDDMRIRIVCIRPMSEGGG